MKEIPAFYFEKLQDEERISALMLLEKAKKAEEMWLDALEKHGLNKEFYANRERSFDEILPWDFIDIGVSKDHLIREAKKSQQAAVTPDCRTRCQGCGADKLCGGYCHAKG